MKLFIFMFSTFTTRFWEFLLQQAWCLVPNLAITGTRSCWEMRDRGSILNLGSSVWCPVPSWPQLIYNRIKTRRCRNCRTKSAALVTNFWTTMTSRAKMFSRCPFRLNFLCGLVQTKHKGMRGVEWSCKVFHLAWDRNSGKSLVTRLGSGSARSAARRSFCPGLSHEGAEVLRPTVTE